MNQNNEDFEVIVIDKGSTDGTYELVSNYSKVQYLIENRGLVRAYNTGWKRANGKFVAILDDDLVAEADYIENIIRTYKISEEVGAVGGPFYPLKTKESDDLFLHEDIITKIPSSFKIRQLVRAFYDVLILGNENILQGQVLDNGYLTSLGYDLDSEHLASFSESTPKNVKESEVDYLIVNMTFRKSILEKMGGFDENYNVGHGDYAEPDLCLKIKSKGYKIMYNPKAILWHEFSSRGVPRGLYERTRNFIYFYWNNRLWQGKFSSLIRFGMYLFIRLLFWASSGGKTKDFGFIKGLFDGTKLTLSPKTSTR